LDLFWPKTLESTLTLTSSARCPSPIVMQKIEPQPVVRWVWVGNRGHGFNENIKIAIFSIRPSIFEVDMCLTQ